MTTATPPSLSDDALIEYLKAHEQKELLRFVTVGSVDDGKSTLIGRLLHDTRGVYDDQLAAVRRASTKRNLATNPEGDLDEIDFSLFTDGLQAEREQGITIDVAYRYFTTAKRKFILADTPGHVQYTRNMATGASTADVAIILLDARLGVLPQSRRHASITALLGIPELIVAVNKMDLVDYRREVFESLREEFGAFVSGLGFRGVTFIPISARKGDNVARHSPRTPWYDGVTVLSFLETVSLSDARQTAPLRFPVQLVTRPNLHYRGFAGTVAAGTVRPGDEVMVLPSRRTSTVVGIDLYGTERASATAPESVTLRLRDEVDIARGDMLVAPASPPRVTDRFQATVVWMTDRPSDPHRRYLLKHTTRTVPARIERVLGKVDMESLDTVPTDALGLNDLGPVVLRCERPLFVDAYRSSRATGAFILIDGLTNDTVAAGMVSEVEAPAPEAHERRYESALPSEVRDRQSRGALVWVTVPGGGDPAMAHAFAAAIEAKRAAAGRPVVVTEVEGNLVSWTTRLAVEAGVTVVALVRAAAPEHIAETRSTLGEARVTVVALPSEPAGLDPVVAATLERLP